MKKSLPYWLFKNCSIALADIVTHIFNLSLSIRLSPSSWNILQQGPHYTKNNPPQSASDLRPISVIPILSRLLVLYIIHIYLLLAIETSTICDQLLLGQLAAPLQRLFSLVTMSPDNLRLIIT